MQLHLLGLGLLAVQCRALEECPGLEASCGSRHAEGADLSEELLVAAQRLESPPGAASRKEALELLQKSSAVVTAASAAEAAGALGANASERSTWADERCRMGVEGTNCVYDDQDPQNNPALWTHYTYCSGFRNRRYRLWRRVKSCEDYAGALSRCVMTGSALGTAQCDDPFCRTRSDGRYCQNGNVVLCQGDAEPQVIESCGPRYEQSSMQADDDGDSETVECTKTLSYSCRTDYNPTCAFTGESSRCDIRRRRGGRRRCNEEHNDGDSDRRRRRSWEAEHLEGSGTRQATDPLDPESDAGPEIDPSVESMNAPSGNASSV